MRLPDFGMTPAAVASIRRSSPIAITRGPVNATIIVLRGTATFMSSARWKSGQLARPPPNHSAAARSVATTVMRTQRRSVSVFTTSSNGASAAIPRVSASSASTSARLMFSRVPSGSGASCSRESCTLAMKRLRNCGSARSMASATRSSSGRCSHGRNPKIHASATAPPTPHTRIAARTVTCSASSQSSGISIASHASSAASAIAIPVHSATPHCLRRTRSRCPASAEAALERRGSAMVSGTGRRLIRVSRASMPHRVAQRPVASEHVGECRK